MQVDGDLKQRLAECRCNQCGAEGAFALVGMDFPNFGRVMCGTSVGPLLAALREDGHFIEWLSTPKELARSRRRTKTLKVDDLTDRCELCLRRSIELYPPAVLSAHHVVEVQHGGEDTHENGRVYCTDCHTLIHWLRRTLGRPNAE